MDFFDRIQLITERFLTRRARIRRIKKEKRKAKNAVLDWIEAFLWAACMVLLLNQYLVQAYRIPSGSMIDTLNIGDHVFVNKIVYGPELLPGFFKLPSPIKPKRNDIIIFENPSYISRGTVFDVAQRVIYMLTLSLVDIDKDETTGEPRVHFLIKRAAGQSGDRFMSENGEMMICFAGENRWVDEREYNALRGWNHNIIRMMDVDQYNVVDAAGKAAAWTDRGLQPSQKLMEAASMVGSLRYPDYLAHERSRLETLRKINPSDNRYAMLLARHRLGWYVPEGRIMPMGDSRDNSRDGRYFGPVRITRVLGRGMIIYWPLMRLGKII
ncbi:MAG: signal peptidase I [Treponema sp.]|nr:signal peptidase I [Treponema sp.]